MKKITTLLTLAFVLLMSGCANKVHTYSTSTENTIALRGLSSENLKGGLGNFSDSGKNESKVMCRLASPIGTPEGLTFSTYIRNALLAELVVANIFDENAKTIVTANLNDIYGSTTIGNAYWEFDITLTSSNGASFQTVSRYGYESSYLATSACSEMQRSFVPAVQKLNSEIIKHTGFASLLK
jgi:hypothetical protein